MALSYDELMTTTLVHRAKKIQDAMSNNSPLMYLLKKKGKIRKQRGGRTIFMELDYAENPSFKFYTDWEQLNIARAPTLTASEADWKQASICIQISGREMLINDGEDAIHDLMDKRISNGEKTFMNRLEASFFGDGTGDGGKATAGLQQLISDAPSSGTVQGIDGATYSWWQNQVYDFSSGIGASSSTNIKQGMDKLNLSMTRNADGPDLWILDDDYFTKYETFVGNMQRITKSDLGDAGFQALRYKGAEVVAGGGMGGSIPTQHGYALNLDYLELVVHPDRFMAPLKPKDRSPINQDGIVNFLGFFGNLVTSNRKMLGVIKE
jgi:hypothetical protein